MAKPKILLQLDGDRHASMFDAVVAIDAGVEHLVQQHQVEPDAVQGLVHGAIFTRGPKDLHNTAIFIGGGDVAKGEQLMQQALASFFGPMRVSVMMDANGANTTAAAAVLSVGKHIDLSTATVTVLGATGPVGQRAALLAALEGAQVRLVSRRQERAEQAVEAVRAKASDAKLSAHAAINEQTTAEALDGANVLISAGAAGAELVSQSCRDQSASVNVIADLNAVPPLGVAGVDVMASGEDQSGVICYGAIGVGGLKMKIHKAAVRRLFESNDAVLDAVEIYQLGKSLISSS